MKSIIEKPWGSYQVLDEGDKYVVKTIKVKVLKNLYQSLILIIWNYQKQEIVIEYLNVKVKLIINIML